jgi:hypothetical protein
MWQEESLCVPSTELCVEKEACGPVMAWAWIRPKSCLMPCMKTQESGERGSSSLQKINAAISILASCEMNSGKMWNVVKVRAKFTKHSKIY